jgi:hypothetical protein
MPNPSLVVSLLLFLGPKLDPGLKAEVEARVPLVRSWAADPVLVEAVRDANAKPYTLEEIAKLDARWQATEGVDDFMRAMMETPAARRMRDLRGARTEMKEAFLTDRLGANVACTNKTSDFYQGDEDKFQVSFAEGKGDVFIGALSRDESTQSYSVQIGAPVMDGSEAIGVLVVTVSVEKLKRPN